MKESWQVRARGPADEGIDEERLYLTLGKALLDSLYLTLGPGSVTGFESGEKTGGGRFRDLGVGLHFEHVPNPVGGALFGLCSFG